MSIVTEFSISPETLQISIPFDLARFAVWQRRLVQKYETNQVIRAFDTWLILKHLTTSSHIKEWNDQKKFLLQVCKCSDSVFRHRLQVLSDLKLIELYKLNRKRDSIRVCSWETLAQVLDIDLTEKLTIQYNINDKQKLSHWLIASEIQDNKNRQDFKIITKLKKNPGIYNSVKVEMIKAGAIPDQLEDVQYFLSFYRSLYYSDFVRVSAIHQEMIEIRPDNNRGVRGMADAWKCKSPVTVSYWKKIMKGTGVIDIASMQIASESRTRNKECKVLWLKKTGQTLLVLCDQVTILQPWLRTDEFKNLFAA